MDLPRIHFQLPRGRTSATAPQNADALAAALEARGVKFVSLQWRTHSPIAASSRDVVTDVTEVYLDLSNSRSASGTIHLAQGRLDVRVRDELAGVDVTERVISIDDGIRTESNAHWTCPRGLLIAALRDLLDQLARLAGVLS